MFYSIRNPLGHRCVGTRPCPKANKHSLWEGGQLNKLNLSLLATTPPLSVFQNNSWRVGAVTRERCAHGQLTAVLFQTYRASANCPTLKAAVQLLHQRRTAEGPVKTYKSASGRRSLVMSPPRWWQWIHCWSSNKLESVLWGQFSFFLGKEVTRSQRNNNYSIAVTYSCLLIFVVEKQNFRYYH